MGDHPKADGNVTTDGRPRLTGWELIENHFVRHDTNIVEGFNKDIDTLLVFAGLFSAVLSAFVVVSLSNLQPDNSQASVNLLLHLSAQTANSSQPAATLPDFQAPTSAVWINSLWFLSLVLSLTSALFGMIAKQWLREYMEWSTTSWLPQRFIVLRQKRFEAFNEWRVPAIIAAIPALLEVALIIFFIGLITFLWTFNLVVAGVSIAVITVSISLAILATVLPVCYRQCPYKSPTGWAILRLAWLIAGAWERLTEKVKRHTRRGACWYRLVERLQIQFDRCTSWKERDFGGNGEDVVDKAVVDALGCTEVCFRDKNKSHIMHRITDADRRAKPLGDLAALHRAFTWVHDTSQNDYLLHAVEQCAATRVTDGCPPLALLAFDFSVACQILDVDPKWMCENLDQRYDITLVHDGVEYAALPVRVLHWMFHSDLQERFRSLWDTRPQLFHQLAETLARDLGGFFCYTRFWCAYSNETSARFLMRIIALCASLTCWTSERQPLFLDCLAPHFHELCEMETDRALPGLASSLFKLLSLHPESIVEHPLDIGFAKLAVSIGERTLSTSSRNQSDLFCRVSSEALHHISLDKDKTQEWHTTITQLFVCMAKIAHHALDRGWQNCGAYSNLGLVWLWPLHDLFCRDRYNGGTHRAQILFPHELIAELTRCLDAGPLTGYLGYLGKLVAKSQRLRDADDAAGPAKVHGAHTPDAEQVHGAPLSTHPLDPLSTSRPTSPIPQSSSHESFAQASMAAAPPMSIPNAPPTPLQELDVSRLLSASASSSYSNRPDVLTPVLDAPAILYSPPAPIAPNWPLDFDEISTSTASINTQRLDIGTPASRDLPTARNRDNAVASTTEDNIELHDLGSSQTTRARSQVLLVEDEHERAGHTATFLTDIFSTPVPSAVSHDTSDLMIHKNEESVSHQPLASPSASSTATIPQSDSPPTHPPSSSLEPGAPPRDAADCSPDAHPSGLSLDCQATPDAGACRPADSLFVNDTEDVPLPLVSTAGSGVRPGA